MNDVILTRPSASGPVVDETPGTAREPERGCGLAVAAAVPGGCRAETRHDLVPLASASRSRIAGVG